MSVHSRLTKLSNAAVADHFDEAARAAAEGASMTPGAGAGVAAGADAAAKTPLMEILKNFGMKHKLPLAGVGGAAAGVGAGLGLSALARPRQQY